MAVPNVSFNDSKRIEVRCHDEVISMQTSDLMRPESNRNPSPLRQYGWMMTFFLGQCANAIREVQGISKIRETKNPFQPLDSFSLY